jgi:hypothetical protein
MKYLKTWSLLEDINMDELKDLCDASFVNLYDLGFRTTILGTDQKMVFLTKNGGAIHQRDIFQWNQIKDYYIPFLQLINRRYEIVGPIHIQSIDWKYYSYDEIVNETIEIPNYRIFSIRILLKEKL